MPVANVGVHVNAKFCDFRLNSGRIIRLFGCPDPFTHFCAVFYCAFAANRKRLVTSYPAGLWGPTIPNKHVKFCDPRLIGSREIPQEAVGGGGWV